MDDKCKCGHPACWIGLCEHQGYAAESLVFSMSQITISDIAAAAVSLGSLDAALVLLIAEEHWDPEEPMALGADWVMDKLGWLSVDGFHKAVGVLQGAGALHFDGECLSFLEDDTAGSVERFLKGH